MIAVDASAIAALALKDRSELIALDEKQALVAEKLGVRVVAPRRGWLSAKRAARTSIALLSYTEATASTLMLLSLGSSARILGKGLRRGGQRRSRWSLFLRGVHVRLRLHWWDAGT